MGSILSADGSSGHSPGVTAGEEKAGAYIANDKYSAPRPGSVSGPDHVPHNRDGLQRNLNNRQIQMIAIGGSIGTALFVSIGTGLMSGGPGSLLIAFILYSCLLGCINNCMAEMTIFMPVSASFVRFADRWVDPAFGFMAGWNFFLYEAILVPFEITALNLILTYWRDDIPIAAVCAVCIVAYALLNLFAVKYYGEAEFWLASGKFLLILVVFCFAFITMIGGNPQHDAYGFRYWNNPGAFAKTKLPDGSVGRFPGFLGSLWTAAFTIVGPEYLAMVAGEAERPRTYLKSAFKTVYWRFGFFYIVGALAIGIIIPYNDPTLVAKAGDGSAAGSPYVIAMQNMGISVLPDFVTALMVTSIFSAGNADGYCAIRCLYGLALNGHAPSIFRKCTASGVPWAAVILTMCFACLSFLSVSHGAGQAITWLTSLSEAGEILDFVIMGVTYMFFFRALKAQGVDRRTLPYRGWMQPWCAIVGTTGTFIIVLSYGYASLLPGAFDIGDFFSHYTMIFVAILTFSGYKIIMRTSFVKPTEADLVWDRPIIDAYEASFAEPPTPFFKSVLEMLHLRKRKSDSTAEL